MTTETKTLGGQEGRALDDVLGDIISRANGGQGQAPAPATPSPTDPGTSQAQAEAPAVPAAESTITQPVAGEAQVTEKVKVKILPDAFYEIEDAAGVRELDGKSLLGEIMLRSDYNREKNALKKLEEEATLKAKEAERITHWVNLAAGDKTATLYLQGLDKGLDPSKALTFAAQATGLDISGILPTAQNTAPQPTPEDPRAKIMEGVEEGDPGYKEKLETWVEYKAEVAENKAYARIKAEQAAERLAADEAAKAEAARLAEVASRTNQILAYNQNSIATVDKYLAERFGAEFESLSAEEKKPVYQTITAFMKAKGLDLTSKEFLSSNLVNERDIEYGVGFAFAKDFSLKPKPAPAQVTGGITTTTQLPLSAGSQSHGLPPVQTRPEATASELLSSTLDSIVAKANKSTL